MFYLDFLDCTTRYPLSICPQYELSNAFIPPPLLTNESNSFRFIRRSCLLPAFHHLADIQVILYFYYCRSLALRSPLDRSAIAPGGKGNFEQFSRLLVPLGIEDPGVRYYTFLPLPSQLSYFFYHRRHCAVCRHVDNSLNQLSTSPCSLLCICF